MKQEEWGGMPRAARRPPFSLFLWLITVPWYYSYDIFFFAVAKASWLNFPVSG